MNRSFVLAASIAALLPRLQAADTFTDFDSPTGTPGTIQQVGSAPAPSIVNEPGTGNFLRLVNEVGNQNNHFVLDATHDGNWSTAIGQFNFRIGNTTGTAADGIGFTLIPQSRAGLTGNGLTDFVAEEPNTLGTLGIGIDLHPNPATNDISLHWNRLEQTNAFTSPTNIVNFVNSGWNQATVAYTQVGNGMNATVQVTRDVFAVNGPATSFTRIDQAVDARPFANRAQFSGRTGGSDLSADLDNIAVVYTGTAATLPVIDPGTRVWQDFDSLGATAYTARLHTVSADILRVGPKLAGTGGSGGGAYMQLMPDGQNDTQSSISLTRAADAGLAPARHLEMDFRMSNPDGITPADGMGLLLLPTATHNISGAGPGLAYENPNVAGALGVGFRVYEGGAVNRVQLHWNGALVQALDLPTEAIDLRSGDWHRLQLETEAVSGGSHVSLSLVRDVNGIATSIPVFSELFVAGLIPYDYRIQTGARSGGLNVGADVDNIRTFAAGSTYVTVNNTVFQNFDDQGTFYQAADSHGIIAGSDGTRHAAIVAAGPSGNFLRLAHAVNSQNVNLGFDQAIPSGSAKPLVEAEFDFRMSGQVSGTERADGFGFGLFGVNSFGTSGALSQNSVNWENALLGNALTLGVRIYDNNTATSTDYLTLNWNGVNIFSANTDTIPGLWDLNDDLFHHAKLTLVDIGADTSASLSFTQDIFGAAPATLTIFSDLLIPGLDLDTFDFRAGLGARTGGLNANYDFDNIVVVPEPGTASLLLGGLALAGLRRRRA